MSPDIKTVYFVLLLTSIKRVASEDLECGDNVKATVGARVTLCCRPNVDKPVVWFFTGRSQADRAEVSNSGVILKEYIGHYELNTSHRGNYHLVIQSVQLEDAGHYVCQEDNGIGVSHRIDLNVSESANGPGCNGEFVQKDTSSGSSGQCKNTSEIVTASIVSVVITLIISGILAFAVIRSLKCKSQRRGPVDRQPLNQDDADWHKICEDIVNSGERFIVRRAGLTWDYDKLPQDPKLHRKYVKLFVTHIRNKHPNQKIDAVMGPHCRINHGPEIARKLKSKFVEVTEKKYKHDDTYSHSFKWRHATKDMTLYVKKNACKRGNKVVIVDEKLSSGDKMKAMLNLAQQMNVSVLGCVVLIEDFKYKTRQQHLDELRIDVKSFVGIERSNDETDVKTV